TRHAPKSTLFPYTTLFRSEVQSKLVAAAERLRLGPGWEEDTDVGPVINSSALEKIHSYSGIGQEEGAKLLTGGEVATENGLDRRSEEHTSELQSLAYLVCR